MFHIGNATTGIKHLLKKLPHNKTKACLNILLYNILTLQSRQHKFSGFIGIVHNIVTMVFCVCCIQLCYIDFTDTKSYKWNCENIMVCWSTKLTRLKQRAKVRLVIKRGRLSWLTPKENIRNTYTPVSWHKNSQLKKW